MSVLVTALSGQRKQCSLLCTRWCIYHVPCVLGLFTLRGVRLCLVDLIFFLIGSYVLLEPCLSLGNIWWRYVWLESAILRSYLILWLSSTLTWMGIRRLCTSIWYPILWTAGRIHYVPAGVSFSLPLWVCVLPLSGVLGRWYSVSDKFIAFADDNGIFLTCDEYIFLFIYGDNIFSEDGHVAIVSCLAHTHLRGW